MLLSILVDLSFNPFQIEVPVMKKLNLITAFYLKILEFISFLLINSGKVIDPYFTKESLTNKEKMRLREKAKRIRKLWRINGYWY